MSATSTVEKCDGWMNKQGFTNGNASLAFPGASAAKAELLDLALTQVSDGIQVCMQVIEKAIAGPTRDRIRILTISTTVFLLHK